MKSPSSLLWATVAVITVLGLVVSAGATTPGTVVYSAHFSSPSSSRAYTLTETVTPGASKSSVTLFLALATNSWNTTYSRAVNASDELQPFLPAISNQTFATTYNGTSLSASVERNGTVPVKFQGGSYSLTSYALTGQVSGALPSIQMNATGLSQAPPTSASGAGAETNYSIAFSGVITAFPSGLVYSLKGTVSGGYSFAITIVSTTLPLAGPQSSAAAEAASVGIGAGAAASALALALGIRVRSKKSDGTPKAESKPEHWVD